MIKNALEYIVGLNKEVKIQEITTRDGKSDVFATEQLYRVEPNKFKAKEIELHTLRGLVDYLRSGDSLRGDRKGAMIYVSVDSPTRVNVFTSLDPERSRESLVTVTAVVPKFAFDAFNDSESFLIGVQANFQESEDRDLILKFAGTVESGTIANYGDDGVTQKATVQQGLVSKSDAVVPNPVSLRPFRTFIEVEQPESEFIFRMKDGSNGFKCALFEGDGGAWKLEAMTNIKEFLEENLKDAEDVVVIA